MDEYVSSREAQFEEQRAREEAKKVQELAEKRIASRELVWQTQSMQKAKQQAVRTKYAAKKVSLLDKLVSSLYRKRSQGAFGLREIYPTACG